jgi:sigma-B regulation protein RsbU (phosphoserine phosphatase)
MRILVIDDSEDSRDLTEGALLSAGYTDVETASSGWQALKILDVGSATDEKPTVDVALLDILMPEMDGVEVCARIRNDRRYADLPIIMVTALDDMNSLSNAFVAGATDYVTKPVNRIELIARVRASLKLKQELDRRQERERELLSFLSSWGDRRAALWIDETTGLFVGEVAEAYLTGICGCESEEAISILALTLDRFDDYRRANGEAAARRVLIEVSRGAAAGGNYWGRGGVLSQRHDYYCRAGGRRRCRARAWRNIAHDGTETVPAEFRGGRIGLHHRERGDDHRAGEVHCRSRATAHPGGFQDERGGR